MNLSTAQAAQRAKEVGVRKVTGATSKQLITQFLTESILQSLLALPLAALLAFLFLPAFNVVTNRDLALGWAQWSAIGGYLLALVLVLGLVSGSYPAFFLSAYKPTDVLKGKWLRRTQGASLRRFLVVAQFSMAIAVAILMTFIYQQVQYMQNQELGFQAAQVLVIPLHTTDASQRIGAVKSQLMQNPNIASVTYTTSLPGKGMSDYGFQIEGVDKDPSVNIYFTEPDFIKTLDLKMAQGRFFSYDHPSDTSGVFVVNEAFVKKYNIASPIGHRMRFPNQPYGTIIGVIKDFHYKSLQSAIEPLVLYGNVKYHGGANYAAIRLATKDIRSTVDAVAQAWKKVEPAHPMQYTFLDEDFAGLYDIHTRLGQTLLYATLLTIFIALLGLFGLASFMAEQRVKEIGVRKVLGATVSQIVLLLGKDFLKLVLIAGLVAVPLALWLTHKWLANFAYQIKVSPTPFLLTILLSLLVAALTVSGRAIKAALINPVKSLRSE
jgi:putative ABC transport system permease protein